MQKNDERITRLKYLEAFKNTIDTGSISGAAKLMGVTQSSVSYLVAKLEETAGTTLFVRANGRLSPTSNALALYDDVDLLIKQIMRVEARFNRILYPYGSRLKLSTPHGYLDTILPRFLRSAHDIDSRIKFQIEAAGFEASVAGLEEGGLDVSLTALDPEKSGFFSIPLARTHHVCILSTSDPLSQKEVVSIADFHGRTLVAQNRPGPLLARYDQLFQEMNVHCDTQVVRASSVLVAEMIDIYGAIARGNSCFAAALCASHPGLCFRPVKELDEVRVLKLLMADWLKDTEFKNTIHRAALDAIRPLEHPLVMVFEPGESDQVG